MADTYTVTPEYGAALSDLLVALRERRRRAVDALADHYAAHGEVDPIKERAVATVELALMGCERDMLG